MPRISAKVQNALNQQINRELASAYVHLAMSA
jgi:ferritin